jgi:hypothetical protein
MRLARRFAGDVAHLYFRLTVRLFSSILPPRFWYAAVFRFSQFHALLLRPLLAASPYRRDNRRPLMDAWLLHAWLRPMIELEKPFPIPIRSVNSQLVGNARSNPRGLVVCSVHLPLVNFLLRSLVDIGQTPTAVVAAGDEQRNRRSPVWGLATEVPALDEDRNVWMAVRSILRSGGSVGALVDRALGHPINPELFRFIRLAGARVVFAIVELQRDGSILVDYFEPPDPYFTKDDAIEANLQALLDRRDALLTSSEKPPSAPLKTVFHAEEQG